MLRAGIVVTALLVALVPSTCHRERHGACEWSPTPGMAPHCRDDLTKQECALGLDTASRWTFTEGTTCPAVGFACIGDALDAAYRKTNPDGTCPPGCSKVTR